MAHSASERFTFLLLSPQGDCLHSDGWWLFENKKAEVEQTCTKTLAGKNVSFLCQNFIALSGKYTACQGDLLFAHRQKYANLHHWLPGKAIGMKQPGLENSNHGQTSDSCLSPPFKKERIYLCFLQSCAWKLLAGSVLHHPLSWRNPNPGEGSFAQPQDVAQQGSPAQGCSSLSSLLT